MFKNIVNFKIDKTTINSSNSGKPHSISIPCRVISRKNQVDCNNICLPCWSIYCWYLKFGCTNRLVSQSRLINCKVELLGHDMGGLATPLLAPTPPPFHGFIVTACNQKPAGQQIKPKNRLGHLGRSTSGAGC